MWVEHNCKALKRRFYAQRVVFSAFHMREKRRLASWHYFIWRPEPYTSTPYTPKPPITWIANSFEWNTILKILCIILTENALFLQDFMWESNEDESLRNTFSEYWNLVAQLLVVLNLPLPEAHIRVSKKQLSGFKASFDAQRVAFLGFRVGEKWRWFLWEYILRRSKLSPSTARTHKVSITRYANFINSLSHERSLKENHLKLKWSTMEVLRRQNRPAFQFLWIRVWTRSSEEYFL